MGTTLDDLELSFEVPERSRSTYGLWTFTQNLRIDGTVALCCAIKRFDAYTNIRTAGYPFIYVYTGFEDTAVYIFQSMNCVAKMREFNDAATSNPFVLVTTFEDGHASGSRQDARDQEMARQHAFVSGGFGF